MPRTGVCHLTASSRDTPGQGFAGQQSAVGIDNHGWERHAFQHSKFLGGSGQDRKRPDKTVDERKEERGSRGNPTLVTGLL